MTLRVLIERCEHNRQDNLHIVANQVAKVFVVPEVQCALGDLKMWAGHGFGQLMEERFLNLGKLGRVHDLENILDFVEKHDFLGAIDLGPVSQKAKNNLNR
jgi:hypothetical protein